MTTKNLAVLGAAAVVLGGAAYFCGSGRSIKASSLNGKPVVDKFDVADVARLEIGGAKKLTLAATEKGWAVESMFGYPADVTKIRENLLKLADLKVGQVAGGVKIASPTTVSDRGTGRSERGARAGCGPRGPDRGPSGPGMGLRRREAAGGRREARWRA